MFGPFDGTGEDAGEKADEQRVFEEVQLGPGLVLVNVDDIAQALEGEVGKAQRRNEVQAGEFAAAAENGADVRRQLAEEIKVFVEEQDAQGHRQRQPQKDPAGPHVLQLVAAQGNAGAPGDHRDAHQQGHQPGVLRLVHVKDVAGHQQQVGFCLPGHTVRQKGHCRKEAQKDGGIKIHRASHLTAFDSAGTPACCLTA